MSSTSGQVEEQFTEATNHWSLEKLYIDLASAKGKGLTPVEKKILRGLLCGYSPAEIANAVYQTRSSSAVRVYLSNGLYKYIEEMLLKQSGQAIKINHWSRVTNLLEKAGYKYTSISESEVSDRTKSPAPQFTSLGFPNSQRVDWGEAIDVSCFYGREQELEQLEQWIVTDRCRLVAVIGMGGMGKTALSVKLAQQVQEKFDYVIWRSLSYNPPIQELLISLIQFLSHGKEIKSNLPDTVVGKVSHLIDLLRSSRCLLVFDGIESILQEGASLGRYRAGYEGYGELFKRIGEVLHQSCLLLTSREKIKEISLLEGVISPVRCFQLMDLKQVDVQRILQPKGLFGSLHDWKTFVKKYEGNPLVLKIASATIYNLFDGNIHDFIEQDIFVFGDIKELLEQHLQRLSALEKSLLYWLVFHRELVLLPALTEDIIPSVSSVEIIETLESLRGRSLIDKHSTIFKAKPLFMKYITEKMIQQSQKQEASEMMADSQPSSSEFQVH